MDYDKKYAKLNKKIACFAIPISILFLICLTIVLFNVRHNNSSAPSKKQIKPTTEEILYLFDQS